MLAKAKKSPVKHVKKSSFFVSSHDKVTAELIAAVVVLLFIFFGLGYAARNLVFGM